MSFHEVVKSSIFGTIPDSNVTSTLVLGGFIFTVCQFLITFVQPAPYGRYTNSSPSYLTCVFFYIYAHFCFVHHIFRFCFLVTWKQSHEKMKILRDLCLHFARQDGQDGKTGKKIMQLK